MAHRELRVPKGARKNRKRMGRGTSSGHGDRCGKGDKGQNARSGGGVRPGFEGGQMPLYRRVARRGFSNIRFRNDYAIVNLAGLERVYQDGDDVNEETLIQKGLINKKGIPVKVLGDGTLSKKLNISAAKVSRVAAEKIQGAGCILKILESGGDPEKRETKGKKGKKTERKAKIDDKKPARAAEPQQETEERAVEKSGESSAAEIPEAE